MKIIITAAPNDWKNLGTRDGFMLPYLTSNQIYYYVYGFPITYSWLLGFGSGVISTLIAAGVSMVFG